MPDDWRTYQVCRMLHVLPEAGGVLDQAAFTIDWFEQFAAIETQVEADRQKRRTS